MPRTKRTRTTKKRRGKGKITDLLKRGNKFLKDTKLVSKLAGTLADAGVATRYTKPVSTYASKLGYGKKRRVRRGKGIKEWLGKANAWLKKTKLISTVGNALAPILPYAGTVGSVASKLGYGKKRRTKRTMRGRGIGHLYTPQTSVGIAGTTTYSRGSVQF